VFRFGLSQGLRQRRQPRSPGNEDDLKPKIYKDGRLIERWHKTFFFSEKDYKVKTKTIQVDFSGGHEIYEPIAKELKGFEIGVLGK
jgi:hypothetical protein